MYKQSEEFNPNKIRHDKAMQVQTMNDRLVPALMEEIKPHLSEEEAIKIKPLLADAVKKVSPDLINHLAATQKSNRNWGRA
jgi:RNA-binding protein YhbY